MTTQELIKALKEQDPEGNTHVRIRGTGVIIFAQTVEGYYDGSYEYLDKDENLVVSTKDYKVDLYTLDLEDFCLKYDGKEVLSKLRFKCSDKIKEEYLDRVKKICKRQRELIENLDNKFIVDMVRKFQAGYTVRDYSESGNLLAPYFLKDGESPKRCNGGEIKALESDLFTKIGVYYFLKDSKG